MRASVGEHASARRERAVGVDDGGDGASTEVTVAPWLTPSSSSPAPRPASAPPPRATPPRPATAVVLAARSEDKLRDLADELGGDERALAVRCDVTEWDDQQALVRAALDAFGRLDVVFANAGFGGPRGFLDGDAGEWKPMVLTNVYGAALTIRATMDAAQGVPGPPAADGRSPAAARCQGSLYSATKCAVTAMGEARAAGLQRHRRPRTLIEPGMVDTPFFESRPEIEALQAEDIARACMFAVSQPPPST